MTSPPPRISGDPSLHHIPPQSLEAEESILSACLLSPESCEEIIDLLRPDNFYRSAHIKIFTAIIELHNKKQPVDLVTLTNRLRENGHLEEIGGAAFLASLVDEIPMAVNVVHYAEIIRDKAAKRLAIQYCNEITQNCFSDNMPAAEIIDTAQNKILSIDAINPDKVTYRSMEDILMDGIDTLDDRFLHKGQLTGVPTGFSAIDELTWGLQPTDLIIIAARPSVGKSSLALNIARHASIDCIEKPFPVGIFSMEMSEQQLLFKFMADLAKINTQKFKSGLFSRQEWQKLTDAAGRMSDAPIHIDDNPGLTIFDVRRRARQMKKKEDIKLLIIDYIQLMSGSGKESRNMEINEISTGLKNLAKELEIPVIALSQLNRKVEDRNDKRPRLSDLRDSGSIEQDSDVIMFIYRDEVYNKDENNPEKGMAEIIISKNRTGPTGFAKLAFINKFASFYELARNDY